MGLEMPTCRNCGQFVAGELPEPVYCCFESSAEAIGAAMQQLAAEWRELHAIARSIDPWTAEEASLAYWAWHHSLGFGGCNCSSDWQSLVASNPPVFGSAAQFFEWTVDMHNLINDKLQKPRMSYEAAWAEHAT